MSQLGLGCVKTPALKTGGDDRDHAAVNVGIAPKADDRSAWARPVLMTAIVTQSISAFELQVAWASPAQSLCGGVRFRSPIPPSYAPVRARPRALTQAIAA
jgi:hypothetical protein